MDDVLPVPQPDWENPVPTDARTPEEVDAFAQLNKTADGLRRWVTTAYLHGVTPKDWAILGESLGDLAKLCLGLGGQDPS